MKPKQITALALSALLALSMSACSGSKSEETTEDTTPSGIAVQVEAVQSDDIATENKVSGTVTADDESSVFVSVTAKCTAVYAKAGDTVRAGEKLCTLDLGSSLSSYNAARISYNSAVQSYQDQKSLLDKQVSMAEDNWTNTQALFEIGAASQ
jgi:multidrug efflux pump subunit AcrA (membrane-fusion protein)